MKTLLRWLSILPALLFPFVIFGFSSQTGTDSGSLSLAICRILMGFINRLFSLDLSYWELYSRAMSIHILIRKIAHVSEYFILSFCVFLPLRVWFYKPDSPNPKKTFLRNTVFPTFFICLLYASADELFQSFVPGRHGTSVDVLIDSIGILLGCIVLTFYYFHVKKIARKN